MSLGGPMSETDPMTVSPLTKPLPGAPAASSNRGSYWITTFGCQMNKADSEWMAEIFVFADQA